MISPDLHPGQPHRLIIAGAPEGQDARVLGFLAHQSRAAGLLHVATDDARLARLAEAVAFFFPEVEILELPAWDCLPYDRVSPNGSIVSQRVDTLTRLLEPRRAGGSEPLPPRLVITTVNAITQRLPPRSAFRHASFSAKTGERVDVERLTDYMVKNGYTRAQTVREPGEFAVRGGIVDLFPPGLEEPLRLDLFGDELDAVRSFDPLSQMTTGKRDAIALKPMSEVFLEPESIQRFRGGYRELFGAVLDDDPLYGAVSEGRKHVGMEHWLPLFHPSLETLFDYLPDAVITLDAQTEEARDQRLAQVADFYQARRSIMAAERKNGAPAYKPVPPEMMFLDQADWDKALATRAVGVLSPFAPVTPDESESTESAGVPPAASIVDAEGRRGRNFIDVRARADVNVFDALSEHIDALQRSGRRVAVAAYSAGARDRLGGLMKDHGIVRVQPADTWDSARKQDKPNTALVVLGIENGFTAKDIAIITEQDILGERLARPARKRRRSDAFVVELASLAPGDFVVHVDHGIGRYEGLETIDAGGAPHDCLQLIYDGGDKLYVPVENIEVVSRYGAADSGATLDKLGGLGWQTRKARVKKRLKDMAEALLKIAAERELRRVDAITTPEGVYDEFAARFPYPETEDQLRAIEQVIEDLASGRPMDRLICGDVGFGKTEVALRAAFLGALGGLQVAVVVPTTLLARQHARTFEKRFAGLPIHIGHLSRFVPPKDAALVKAGLADGTIDIVIGTHALLAKGISFKRLGMVVIDEEQHFGVKQKERLKSLRADVHVLTLTATPIPRTLQMALSGVRELSLIATPPVDRLAVRTFVLPFDPVVIREAILREHFRGGQTFYVCPRLEDIPKVEERIKELVPEIKLGVAHGRMTPGELEDIMTAFDDGKFDVLLSTNIVESGLDIPSANTLIVHRADMFGLSQLYQLRGRVGRAKTRGYAYFTYQPRTVLSATAQQRLQVIEMLDSLGAGFQLASHDMDIRGAGNLLGEEQSGHIREVGVELYQQMLEDAVAAAREGGGSGAVGTEAREQWSPQIHLGMPVLIPETYVTDLTVRLGLYRRIADLASAQDIEAFAAEMIDRFGPLPPETDNLLAVVGVKQLCRQAGIERLDAGPRGAVMTFRNNNFEHPERLVPYITRQAGTVRLRPDHKLVVTRSWDDTAQRLTAVRRLMTDLAKLAA